MPERGSLTILLFHSLFTNEAEVGLKLVYPQQNMTVANFTEILQYYLDNGFNPVSPSDILKGLSNRRKHLLVTFDDGYYSSKLSLPVLKQLKIPAVFFVSLNHMYQNKSFWWDVLWRERIKRGASVRFISHDLNRLKSLTNEEIDRFLGNEFGQEALEPVSDVDRPFTVAEFQDLAVQEGVSIGNHTFDHVILTNYPSSVGRKQIKRSQEEIERLTGITPLVISYPNGNYTADILRFARESGLKMGITTTHVKNRLPIGPEKMMYLGRFMPVADDRLRNQLDLFRSDIAVTRLHAVFRFWAKRGKLTQ